MVLFCPSTKFSPRTNLYICPETIQFLPEPLAKGYVEVPILYVCPILKMEVDLPKLVARLLAQDLVLFA